MATSPGVLDPTDTEIANRITSAMLIKGISTQALSDSTGISYGSLRRSLNGSRSLTFQEFHKISQALGVEKSALLTDELAGRAAA